MFRLQMHVPWARLLTHLHISWRDLTGVSFDPARWPERAAVSALKLMIADRASQPIEGDDAELPCRLVRPTRVFAAQCVLTTSLDRKSSTAALFHL